MSGPSTLNPNFEREIYRPAAQVAEQNDCDILYPEDNQLFLDIECEEHYAQYERQFAILQQKYSIDIDCEPSRSGKPFHYHIILTFENRHNLNKVVFSPVERLFLQCALGSDPKRDLLGYLNILNKNERDSSVFFEKKTNV